MSSEILICQNPDGNIKRDVRLEEEAVWLTQAQMGQLFGKDKRTISEHIGTIFKEGELNGNVVVRNFRTTTQHGAISGKTLPPDSDVCMRKFGMHPNLFSQNKCHFMSLNIFYASGISIK